jgi:hypothetical protein
MLGTCKTERSEMSTYFVLKPEGKGPSKIIFIVVPYILISIEFIHQQMHFLLNLKRL